MRKTSKNKRPVSAESIARLADKGEDVSSYFTNKGRMMPPIEVVKTHPQKEASAEFRLGAETLDKYRRCTQQLMGRVHQFKLVNEFFFVFSRFEHALSTSKYLTEEKSGVSPDWNKFARDLNNRFQAHVSEEVRSAIRYYEAAPPKKQIVDFDSVTWKDVLPQTDYQLERLLLLVRRVRNNLFHGEKLGVLLEGDSERDTRLLKHGLTILYACLQISSELRTKFFSEVESETENEEDQEILGVSRTKRSMRS